MLKRRIPAAQHEVERAVADPERARERTMNRAIRLLAARPRSERELRERLLEKPWTNEAIVDAVVTKLKDHKYVDDEQYARDFAASKLRQKPVGKRRLQQALGQKKLDKTTVDAAIEHALEKTPEDQLIDAAIEKRVRLRGVPQNRDEMRKLYEHLLRQGFGYDLVRDKLAALTKGDLMDQD
jgi:regulatory protein